MVELDLKDRKLLYELDLDSRQPVRELARKVGLSKDSAAYRIDRLCKSGVIKRFQTLVDVGKLGYISFRLLLKLQNVTPRKEAEIISFLKSDRRVAWIVSVEDGWDINTWIVCRSVSEMNDFWKELMRKYRNYIDRHWFSIYTKVVYFSKNYLCEGQRKGFVFISEPTRNELDDKSGQILRLLVLNSRISSVEIAEKVGVTTKTVISKIRQMEKEKLISCYRLVIDLDRIGYKYYKLHIKLHNLTPEKEQSLRVFISSHPNVVYTDEVLGGEDAEVELHVRDVEELRDFISHLKEKFAGIIRTYDLMLYYKEHKYIGLPV